MPEGVSTELPPGTEITELIREGKIFARNIKGKVELVEVKTGRVVAIKKDLENITAKNAHNYIKTVLEDGSIAFVEEGMEWALKNMRQNVYKPYVLDVICQRICMGEKLIDICQDPEMPDYATLARWRREFPEVGEAIRSARRDRAEMLRDMAVREAEGAESDDPFDAAKLRVETYLKVAAIDNPEYSAGRKVDVAINAPTMIVVNTGIDLSKEVDITPAKLEDFTHNNSPKDEVTDVRKNSGKA